MQYYYGIGYSITRMIAVSKLAQIEHLTLYLTFLFCARTVKCIILHKMRLSIYILSLYLLALAVIPCSDVAYTSTVMQDLVVTSTSGHNDPNNDINDICSPFCQCTCCSITATSKFTSLKLQLAKPAMPSSTYPVWKASFVSNYYGNIWQPPKINA